MKQSIDFVNITSPTCGRFLSIKVHISRPYCGVDIEGVLESPTCGRFLSIKVHSSRPYCGGDIEGILESPTCGRFLSIKVHISRPYCGGDIEGVLEVVVAIGHCITGVGGAKINSSDQVRFIRGTHLKTASTLRKLAHAIHRDFFSFKN